MKIFFQEKGLISDADFWVCIHGQYMYCGDTLRDLIEVMNAEWEQDLHLI